VPFLLVFAFFFQAETLATKGKLAMEAGRFDEAVRIYQDLAKASPTNPGLRLNLAMALHMAGRDQEAIPAFQQVLKAQPSTLPALAMLGASYMRTGNPKAAIPVAEKAVAMQPADQQLRSMLVDALLMVGREEEAIPHLNKLTAQDPKSPRAWHGLGRVHEVIAQKTFEEMQRTAPESPWTIAIVAEVRAKQQQYASALALYREALKRNPDLPGAREAVAEIYRKTGHDDWAKTELQKAKPVSPAAASAPEANLYRKIRDHNDRAVDAFSRLEKMPPSVEIHQLRAEINGTRGRHAEAVKELESALKLDPNNAELHREFAVAVYSARDYKNAEVKIRELLKLAPGDVELNFLLGDTLLNLQQADAALPYLKLAVERDSQLLPAHALLGRAYIAAGLPIAAVPHLEAALPVDSDGSLHYQLSRAYQASGESERAKKMLARYQELSRAAQVGSDGTEAQITPP
jgi:predicted Zn-dependent protease